MSVTTHRPAGLKFSTKPKKTLSIDKYADHGDISFYTGRINFTVHVARKFSTFI
jgi:hypothetical protein